MQKILINKKPNILYYNFWSWEAIIKILEEKDTVITGYYVGDTHVTEEQFLASNADYKYIQTADELIENNEPFDRDDPDAIRVFELYGSEFCSNKDAEIEAVEYDEELVTPRIVGGFNEPETIEWTPAVSEKTVRACKDLDEVVNLLKSAGVL